MSASLPPNPSLRFLQIQAKELLKHQRMGDARVCPYLRLLRRYQDANDAEILNADVALNETQHALARHYGFESWQRMRQHLQERARPGACSLDAVRLRASDEIPEYAAAGVPLAIVAALNHAGESLDFVDFAAAGGWAFSFGYQYDDIAPAFMAVRGRPDRDGPLEIFAFVPKLLGFGYESARTDRIDELWPFVVRHVDQGTPIISEHLDGGLLTNYRSGEHGREFEFDATVGAGWIAAERMQPHAVYVLVRERDPVPDDQFIREAINRAVQKGSAHHFEGVPQGLAALAAYLADVTNPAKDFAACEEWFCWAAFQRLLARQCSAAWLQRIAVTVAPDQGRLLLDASRHYHAAYQHYERYRTCIMAGEPGPHTLEQRARSAERIAEIGPILSAAIDAEKRGLDALRAAAY